MNQFAKWSLLGCAALFTFACGNKSADQVAQDVKNTANQVKDELSNSTSWASNCKVYPIPGIAGSRKYVLDFSNNKVTKKTLYYSGTNCAQQDQTFVVQSKGDVTFPEGVRDQNSVRKINFNFKSETLMAVGSGTEKIFNGLNVCGLSHWKVNQEQDVTGAKKGTLNCWAKGARTDYDLIQIAGNQLFLGADADNEDGSHYPANVDKSNPYNRQK